MSVYDRVIGEEDRTNNFAEAAHRRMQRELPMDHTSLWKFIETLKNSKPVETKTYEEFVRGEHATPKRQKY
jgi:hypothetical protein